MVCAWCSTTIRDGSPDRVSHGLCTECAFTLKAQQGKGIRQLLQRTSVPYIVVDGDAVVIDANDTALAMLHKTREEVVNQRGGVVLACERSGTPEGCGRAAQCDACRFRDAIIATFADGVPRTGYVSEHPVMGSKGLDTFQVRFSTCRTDGTVVVSLLPPEGTSSD